MASTLRMASQIYKTNLF
uniref:Uncharacterized protein n=1 Tax=Anguilla anguilla TaxID=7936 RepID=A0A0E9QD28_ANGAN